MRRRATALVFCGLAVVFAGATVTGCGASTSNGMGTPNGNGGHSNEGSGGVSSGSGGFSSDAGAPGGSSGGLGGATAGPGGRTGTDAGVDAPGDGGPVVGCSVQIKSVFPPTLLELPSGPNAKLRVRGSLVGAALARPPVWSWKVTMPTNNQPMPVVTPDPHDPALIEFPLPSPGRYDISVSVSDDPPCKGSQTATAVVTPSAWYWVRITPPSSQVDVPPYEEAVRIQAGQGLSQHIFTLVGGLHVTLDPFTVDPQTKLHQAVSSYVLISSLTHTWSRTGETQGSAFATSIPDFDSGSLSRVLYDVLVVPLAPGAAGGAFAPLLLSRLFARDVNAQSFELDAGASVTGHLTSAAGPVQGATVSLRAGGLPSTIGTSGADGAFGLRARAGRFSAVILPPEGSSLPQARVDVDAAAATSGVVIATAPTLTTVSFAWRSDLTTASFAAHFTTSDQNLAAALDVRLESEPDAFPDVGTLQVTSGGAGSQALVASGNIRRLVTTDAAGVASFADLPRGRYRLIAVPTVSSPDSLTVTALDLTGAATSSAVALVSKVAVSGRLVGAAAGTRVLVIDDQPLLGRDVPAVTLAADGSYAMLLDAAHGYHLITDPPTGRKLSRVALAPIESTGTAASLALGDQRLPGMLSIAGQVLDPTGTPMPGAVLQVYCMGAGPDCIDDTRLGAGEPLPLFEAATDARGGYALFVPDPAAP